MPAAYSELILNRRDEDAKVYSSIKDMINDILVHENASFEEVKSRKTARRIVRARRKVYVELKARGISLARIGQVLGGRHHTTVLDGIKRFERGEKCTSVTEDRVDAICDLWRSKPWLTLQQAAYELGISYNNARSIFSKVGKYAQNERNKIIKELFEGQTDA